MARMNLPLFPLNSVLFPGMPLRLHVFEHRYKLLVRQCLEKGSPFGVVLISSGQEALGPLPDPHRVGCTARINYLEPLGDGRSNLLAVGQERFRLLHISRHQPYLIARVETLSFAEENESGLTHRTPPIRRLLDEYLQGLGDLGQWQEQDLTPPQEPAALAFLACGALQIPNEEKQRLLASKELSALFDQIERLLQRELALVQQLALRGLDRLERASTLN